jgi:hypothetical protein
MGFCTFKAHITDPKEKKHRNWYKGKYALEAAFIVLSLASEALQTRKKCCFSHNCAISNSGPSLLLDGNSRLQSRHAKILCEPTLRTRSLAPPFGGVYLMHHIGTGDRTASAQAGYKLAEILS